jgi:PAS domain S-box-containing protein
MLPSRHCGEWDAKARGRMRALSSSGAGAEIKVGTMRHGISRFTHAKNFRPGPLLSVAIGVTALFCAVIALNVQLAHHLPIILLVSDAFMLLLTAVWILAALPALRFYRTQAQAEAALRQSENRYRVLLENLPQKIFLKDRNSVYVSCNKNYARDLKIKPWEIPGKTDYEFFPKELAEKYRADDQRIMESGEVEEIEEQYVQDGKEVFVHTVKTPIRDEHGHVSGILGIFWDITEHKRVQEALQESETKYRALIDALPFGAVILQDGILVFANPAAAAMFGCANANDLVGLPWLTALVEEDRERVQSIFEARARGKAGVPSRYTVTVKRHDGETFPAEVYVQPFQYGGRFAVQAVAVDLTERRRVEEALRESEERFRNLADTAPVLIWMAGVNRHTYYFNRTWLTFTGRTLAQEYGRGWQDNVHPEDLPRVLAAYDSAFAARSPFTVDFRLLHADGGYRWMMDTGVPRFASEQRFTGYIGSCIDITSRREAEQALRASENRYRVLVENLPQKIFLKDRHSVYISCNKNYAGDLKIKAAEIGGRTDYEFFPRELAEKYRADDNRIMELGEAEEIEEQYVQDGKEVSVRTAKTPIRDEQGRVSGILGIFWDITERKRNETIQSVLLRIAEAASIAPDLESLLEEIRVQLSRLMDARNFFLALYDESKDVYEFVIFCDEHDAPPGKAVHAPRSLTDYVRRTGAPILADAHVIGELVRSGEVEMRGTPARQWMGVPLHATRGVIGVMAVRSYTEHVLYTPRDLEIMTLISGNLASAIERKRAVDALIASEQQLRHAQKMEAIGRLAGGIAHDFNNILTTILGHSDAALHQLPEASPLHGNIQEVAKAAEHAATLTRQLLTFSRKQPVQTQVLDLNAIVADSEKMLRYLLGNEVELVTRLHPDLGSIRADHSQIEQVLMNLVVNSRDAMTGGGRLVIETANVEPGQVLDRQLKDLTHGRWVMLAVTDNGVGMDAETKSHIFEPFFTTKEPGKGTGLGLSTVYGIVKQSGGQIWLYSEPGRGTVFRIYLPCATEPTAPEAPCSAPGISRGT